MKRLKTAIVTGADRNIGLEMCRELLSAGWFVYAGKFLNELYLLEELQQDYPDLLQIVPLDCSSLESVKTAAKIVCEKSGILDMAIHNAAIFRGHGGDLRGTCDFTPFIESYNINALGAIRLVQCFAPLMEKSNMKRLCFVSSEAGVVSVSHRKDVSGYCMSKTALNMALRIMFNDLRPKGYTFRLYHPGWVRSPKIEHQDQQVNSLQNGKFEPWEAARSAIPQFIEDRDWENCMVLIDNEGAVWPF